MRTLLTLFLTATVAKAQVPQAWQYPLTVNRASTAQHAMVASGNRQAAQAGVETLKAGGNAVDAAVAVGFALAVTYPEAGNIGGGGYMVIRMADGRTAALDYRETAPAAAFRNMYVDSAGTLTAYSINSRSASGVPGAVAGLTAAHSKFGVLPLAKVMEPAIRMAEQGIIIDSVLSRSLRGKDSVIRRYAGGEVFFPGEKPIPIGSRLIQTDLANTLRVISRQGASGFYRGKIAALIAAEMRRDCPAHVSQKTRASHGCGIITQRDLARYQPVWRKPIRTGFRGYSLITMPPSSSSGITIGETLNILDGPTRLPAPGSAQYVHLLTSAFQRAFIDRNSLLGDPAFVKIPLDRLSSRSYAAQLRSTIDSTRHTPTSSITMPMREAMETTHYSVVDEKGNAVSTTTTLNGLYGSGVFVKGAGFFLNNTMDDFASQPGTPNMFGLVQGEANAIAPGKRMLSAMSPTIIVDPTGKLFMVLGARGGPRIITSTVQVILNVIENGMSLSGAMSAPRIHHQALPDDIRIDDGGFDAAVVEKLKQMGYTIVPQGYIGGSVVAIRRVSGGWEGMDDPRGRGGAAVGY
jgi:gamma-glutamyltranspeptidase/glutathione hydrolase